MRNSQLSLKKRGTQERQLDQDRERHESIQFPRALQESSAHLPRCGTVTSCSWRSSISTSASRAQTLLFFAVSISSIRVSFPHRFLRCCLAKNCPSKFWLLRTHSRIHFRVRVIHHGFVQVLVDCLVTDSLDQFLAVVGNGQPLEHEVGFHAISQRSRLCAIPRQLIQYVSRCPCRCSCVRCQHRCSRLQSDPRDTSWSPI